MTLYNYLKGRNVLRTIKGNLEQLNTTTKNTGDNGELSYIHQFKINEVYIELMTKTKLKAKEGEQVLVAGILGPNRTFKAFSLKTIN